MTKSQLVFVSATIVLGVAAAFHWYAAPSAHFVAHRTSGSQRSVPLESLAESRPPDFLPMTSASPSITAPDSPPNEAILMQRLRSVEHSDPALAIQMAHDGNRRFPDTPAAPERASILIHALARLNRSSEARGEAEQMVNHYPDSQWVQEIERFTGAHRHRNLRVDDEGNLEAYDP